MCSVRTNRITSYLWLCIVAISPIFFCHGAIADEFPRYKEIEKNVQFWEKIYSTYSLTQAVIHDSKDLSKIYEVIELLDESTPGATQFNKKAQKKAVQKYQKILKKLSKQRPVTPEEKRVASFYSGNYRSRNMGRASETVRSQKGQKERFRQGVVRSGTYITEIKRLFRVQGLPEDLAYLPHVESSFNTKAYSKFGAAGIWQFTRSTGKRYLGIDYSIDERLDPILASHAAAQYLKNSYTHLGNWPSAITSYNYGLPGMIRAQNELGSYPVIFKKYNKGHFKFASKNFYSEFLAARKVAKYLEQKIKINRAENVSYLKLQGYVALDTLSRHLQIPPQTITGLNPAIRPPVIKGEKRIPKGYRVRLPNTDQIHKRLARLPSSVFKKDQRATRFHRVQSGETAGSIAKRYGVSLKSLMKANNLDGYATIFIKQKLRIPVAPTITVKKIKKDYTSATPGNKQHKIPTLFAEKKQRPKTQRVTSLPAKNPTVYNVYNLHRKNGKPYGEITVQPEESLRLYADLLKTSVTSLRQLNNLTSTSSVTPGQQVVVPFDKLTPNSFEEKRLDFLQETEDDFFAAFSVVGQKSYTVSTGDTLWDLCYNKFEIPLWLLERYNSAIDLLQLSRNQTLVIPIVQQI
ncbi:LysM peptidoglycan-binding domain-containing protein [Desulforhopalus sp. 52FAK]